MSTWLICGYVLAVILLGILLSVKLFAPEL
jgi:hypothetical protein